MATESRPAPWREAAWYMAGSLALLLGVCAPAGAVEVEVQGGLVAIRATEDSLRTVLEALAERCDLEIRSSIPMPEAVTIDTGRRPLPQLLRMLLRDHSYVLQYSDDGAGARALWILAPAGSDDVEASWSTARRDRSLDKLALALADSDTEVRVEAVLSLGDIGSPAIAPLLNQSLVDESADVREAARAVLEDMGMAEARPRGTSQPACDRREPRSGQARRHLSSGEHCPYEAGLQNSHSTPTAGTIGSQ